MLQFTIDKTHDPDGSQLRRLFQAQLTCERIASARSLLAHRLAITGMVIGLGVVWSALLGPEIRFFALAVFGGFLILALGIVIEELAWRVKLKRCLKVNEGVKAEDTYGAD